MGAPKLKRVSSESRLDPFIIEVLEKIKESDLSMAQIEEKSGVSSQTIHGWANGQDGRLSYLKAVVEALGHEIRVEVRDQL